MDGTFSVELRPLPSDLSDLDADWCDLQQRAGATNVFFAPWMISLAADAFAKADPRFRRGASELATVWHQSPSHRRQLVGLLPVHRKRSGWFSVPRADLLRYYFCSLCTPPVDPAYVEPVLDALLSELVRRVGKRAALSLPMIERDSPFARQLRSAADRGRFRQFEEQQIERGYAAVAGPSDVWKGFSRRRRHDLQRRERRLGELGVLSIDHYANPDDTRHYAEQFLALESAGWKGRSGTALGGQHHSQNYFLSLCDQAAERDVLRATRLTLDARPVAMVVSLVCPPESYAIRIAYDEGYAPYSPGHLVVRRHLEWLAGQPEITGSDSCADPTSEMANANWRDRKALSNFTVALRAE